MDVKTPTASLPLGSIDKFITLLQWQLWGRGSLRFYLYDYQKRIYDHFKRVLEDGGIFIGNISRQAGKSTVSNVICLELCASRPNFKIIYGAPEKEQADSIFEQNAAEILRMCPPWITPEINKVRKTIKFPNGSIIRIVGLDNPAHRRRLRGKSCDLFIIDEGAFVAKLDDLIGSVIQPMFNATNNGVPRIIIPTTPNEDPGHHFETLVQEAKRTNKYLTMTIHDVKTPDQVERIMEQYHTYDPAGNIIIHANDNPKFQREYLCMLTSQQDKLVCPYWIEVKKWCINTPRALDMVEAKQMEARFGFPIKQYRRPQNYIPMVVSDYGWDDYTGVVFGHVDFEMQKMVIVDELFFKNKLPSEMGQEVLKKMRLLWPSFHPDEVRLWVDTGATGRDRIAAIKADSGLRFSKVNIRDKRAAITKFNSRVANSQLIVFENCINTINTLEKASWVFDRNGNRKDDFERNDELGHCDLLDALIAFNHHAPWSLEPEFRGQIKEDRLIGAELRDKIEKQQTSQFAQLKTLTRKM